MDFMTAKGERNKTAKMTAIALMTAAACVLGPFSIPVPMSPVPISLTNLVICFMAYVLGARQGTAACGLYLLLGAVGMPVFGGFSGGLGTLLGPTGGYLIGFLFLAALAGSFIVLVPGKRTARAFGMILGTAVLYLFGTVWLARQLHLGFGAALMAVVIPYLPGDAAKIILAAAVGPKLRKSCRAVLLP